MYILKRTSIAVVTLWLAITIAFVLARGTGDPVRVLTGAEASEEVIEAMRQALGLDRPFLVQYGEYLLKLATGDLGQSLRFGVSNAQLIAETLPTSAKLALAAVAIAVVVGIALGSFAATHSGTIYDRFATTAALLGQSTPSFWIGLILILIFAENLRWLPAGRDGGFYHLILPAVTLSSSTMAKIALLTRSGMISALAQDYVLAAKARGIARWRIVYIHALRNAMLPVLTITALQIGTLISAAVTVELVFSWPGMGQLAVSAVLARDFPLVQALVLVGAGLFVVLNLVADIAYTIVDPRVRR